MAVCSYVWCLINFIRTKKKKKKRKKIDINKHLPNASLILNAVKQGAVSSSLRHCALRIHKNTEWDSIQRDKLLVYAHEGNNKGYRNSVKSKQQDWYRNKRSILLMSFPEDRPNNNK
jgi:hypothetical protein